MAVALERVDGTDNKIDRWYQGGRLDGLARSCIKRCTKARHDI